MAARTAWYTTNAAASKFVRRMLVPASARKAADQRDHALIERQDALGCRDAQPFHREHAVQRRRGAIQPQELLHHLPRHRPIGFTTSRGEHPLDHRTRALELAILQGVEDRIAIGEVLVKRADAHARDLGHARGARGFGPFVLENANHRVQNRAHRRA